MSEEMKKFIEEGLERGFSIDELKKRLIDSGWPEEEINKEISLTSSPKKEIKKRPIGIKLISYFHYFLAIITLVGFLISLFSNLSVFGGGILGASIGITLIMISAIFTILFALVCYWAGRGIWKGKNGWRVFVLVISILVFLLSILIIINMIINVGMSSFIGTFLIVLLNIIIPGYIIYYLLINKIGRGWFKQ